MAEIHVKGLPQLQRNLAAFGDDKVVGRIIKAALAAGGRVVRPKAASNARALGLGRQGIVRDENGRSYKVYGRIPKAIKVGRAYVPRGLPDLYRLNVVARGQSGRTGGGIYKNRAPHAHLIEYGWNHKAARRRIDGREYIGPALEQTATQVVEKIRDTMAKRIERERFPL
jgi:hypothetical protein